MNDKQIREVMALAPTRGYLYKFQSPYGDGDVWRTDGGMWNGQKPSEWMELVDRAEIESALREQVLEVPTTRDAVEFIGACDAQVNWGGGDDPRMLLVVGGVYAVEKKDVHSMHTRLYLEGFPGKWFNSVCFKDVSAAPQPAQAELPKAAQQDEVAYALPGGGHVPVVVRAAAPPQREPMTDEQKMVLAFLNGEAPLDGLWFGELHDAGLGAFWWRRQMNKAFNRTKEQQ